MRCFIPITLSGISGILYTRRPTPAGLIRYLEKIIKICGFFSILLRIFLNISDIIDLRIFSSYFRNMTYDVWNWPIISFFGIFINKAKFQAKKISLRCFPTIIGIPTVQIEYRVCTSIWGIWMFRIVYSLRLRLKAIDGKKIRREKNFF